jgi:hypothetical protein
MSGLSNLEEESARRRRRRLAHRRRAGGGAIPIGPYFVRAGTLQANSNASSITCAWPAGHQANDIGLLFCETAQTSQTTPAGWTTIANAQQGTGSGLTATRLQSWWARASSSAEAAAVLGSVSVDHRVGVMLLIRGCVTTGDPIHVSSGDILAAAATAFTIPGGTTSIDNCLIIAAIANGIDISGPQATFDPPYTEVFDMNNTISNGGGIAVATLLQTPAGGYPAATGQLASAFAQGRASFALLPA